MIIEETFEFECDENDEDMFKASGIEEFIKSKGIEPVRFSLLSRDDNKIRLGVSGIRK